MRLCLVEILTANCYCQGVKLVRASSPRGLPSPACNKRWGERERTALNANESCFPKITSAKCPRLLTSLPPLQASPVQPHHIAQGHAIYELFKNRIIAHGINIQTFSIICCQLSPSIAPPLALLSVILLMICIPVALGWSELSPIDATCQACWAGLDWAALFFLLPHWFTGRWFLSLFHYTLLKLAQTSSHYPFFFFLHHSVYILKCSFLRSP